jgi:thymidine kinase
MSKLFWRYGAMGSGKSLALIGVAHNYERIGQRAAIFTAKLDTRLAVGVVGSRLGVSRPALTFDEHTRFTPEALSEVICGVSCVLVDEAQFLSRQQVVDLHRLASKHGVPVICYGLRTDFRGHPFEGGAWLGALADVMEELRTVCDCGSRASFNMRVDDQGRRIRDGQQVAIGGDAMYRAKCPDCFYEGN